MSKNKAVIISSVVAVAIVAGAVGVLALHTKNNNQDQNVTLDSANASYENKQNTFAISSMIESNFDASDSQAMFERSDYVAIVHVDSIDGVDNYAEVINQPARVFTYGKFTVIDTFKGSLNEGETKNFYRVGGTMPFDKYCQHISEVECSKLEALNTDRNDVSYAVAGDIDIEQGKTYLAYLKKDEALRAVEGYTFQENQGGLREIQTAGGYSANSNIKVLNNFTGEWENLSDIVKQ